MKRKCISVNGVRTTADQAKAEGQTRIAVTEERVGQIGILEDRKANGAIESRGDAE